MRFFVSGFGALIFSPLFNVAKVEIPKSIGIYLSDFGKYSAQVFTTKLAKYLFAESLMIVTDVGLLAKDLDQTIFILPIF
ncbi:hypothetical protein [Okeania sp. SIO2B3]|uniref:hypothetical protein n=1 Tax=Okeania sp. SIO2B3 TaxID=2607784 RepID=UPI0013BF8A26|nr:hypothetical protein [Okeania sp. SIO2B3]NET44084.1 hypothetical protein [Okeania sp. SIO2B3]